MSNTKGMQTHRWKQCKSTNHTWILWDWICWRLLEKHGKHDSTNEDLVTAIPKKVTFSTISKTTPPEQQRWNLKKERHFFYKPSSFGLQKNVRFFGVCANPPKLVVKDCNSSTSWWNVWKKQLHGREPLIFPRNGFPAERRPSQAEASVGGSNGELEGWSSCVGYADHPRRISFQDGLVSS